MENNQTPAAGPQRVPWNKGKLIGVRSLSARRRCSSTDGRGTSGRSSYAPGRAPKRLLFEIDRSEDRTVEVRFTLDQHRFSEVERVLRIIFGAKL